MIDCEYCINFKWEKKRLQPSSKMFDIPMCKLKNKEVQTPAWAEKCKEFDCKQGENNCNG